MSKKPTLKEPTKATRHVESSAAKAKRDHVVSVKLKIKKSSAPEDASFTDPFSSDVKKHLANGSLVKKTVTDPDNWFSEGTVVTDKLGNVVFASLKPAATKFDGATEIGFPFSHVLLEGGKVKGYGVYNNEDGVEWLRTFTYDEDGAADIEKSIETKNGTTVTTLYRDMEPGMREVLTFEYTQTFGDEDDYLVGNLKALMPEDQVAEYNEHMEQMWEFC